MNIFENVKMKKLLKERGKLNSELVILENAENSMHDVISETRRRIRDVNLQIGELLKD